MTAGFVGKLTYPEYLALESSSEEKHEYADGLVYPTASGHPARARLGSLPTPEHARLAFEIGFVLRRALEGKACRVFSAGLRVRIESTNRTTHPDLTVVCGELQTSPEDPNAAINPTVLVEVLSEGTESADRIEKWAHYRRIPSLQAYVLVAQSEQRIETYRRDGTRWIFEEAGPGEVARVGGIEVDVAIDALYASALAS